MGYRSDVEILIKGPYELTLDAFTRFVFLNPWADTQKDPLTEHVKLFRRKDELLISLVADDWKWYKSFPEIARLENMWTWFYHEYSGSEDVSGAYVRIGEDEDDVATDYFGEEAYDLLRVPRTIVRHVSFDNLTDVRLEPHKDLETK